jgi:hypothetical protein
VSLAVLELNDAALVLGDAGGVLARSPGFALLAADAPVMGEAARACARIEPRRTMSQFWQRLGTEPLHHAPAHTRHHADLGYRHLLHVHELGGKPAELLLAVPGSFSREQLALLLGIAEGWSTAHSRPPPRCRWQGLRSTSNSNSTRRFSPA